MVVNMVLVIFNVLRYILACFKGFFSILKTSRIVFGKILILILISSSLYSIILIVRAPISARILTKIYFLSNMRLFGFPICDHLYRQVIKLLALFLALKDSIQKIVQPKRAAKHLDLNLFINNVFTNAKLS